MNKKNIFAILALALLVLLFVRQRSQEPESVESAASPITHNPEAVSPLPIPVEPKAQQNKKTKDSFDVLIESVRNSIPTQAQIRNSPSGTHDTPPELLKASAEISKVEEQMESDPSKVSRGIEFFNACARIQDTAKSLRSVCLRKSWDWNKRAGATPSSDNDIPEDIKRMARFLPGN